MRIKWDDTVPVPGDTRDAAPAGPWLPTTPEAVRIGEAELGVWPIGLPERLKDPMAILDRHLRSRD